MHMKQINIYIFEKLKLNKNSTMDDCIIVIFNWEHYNSDYILYNNIEEAADGITKRNKAWHTAYTLRNEKDVKDFFDSVYHLNKGNFDKKCEECGWRWVGDEISEILRKKNEKNK